eukprot:1363889-Amorphochlora_amoeboformis.AAC.3
MARSPHPSSQGAAKSQAVAQEGSGPLGFVQLFPISSRRSAPTDSFFYIDITNRILRKENYMISMVDTGVFSVEALPFGAHSGQISNPSLSLHYSKVHQDSDSHPKPETRILPEN